MELEDTIQIPSNKMFFTIGEVADMFGVNTSLVRFWEKEFDILKPRKNAKGNRLFTQKDIQNFKLIYYLVKEKGMTISGAKRKIKENAQDTDYTLEIVEKLKSIKQQLIEIRQYL